MSRNTRASRKRKREDDEELDIRIVKKQRLILDKRQLVTSLVNEGKKSQRLSVWGAGAGDFGQLGPDCKEHEAAIPFEELKDVNLLDMECGSQYTVLVETSNMESFRNVWSWGQNDEGSLGRIADDEESTHPNVIPELETKFIVQVCTGECHAAALDSDGFVYTWGIYKAQEGFLGFKPGRPRDEIQDVPELMEELANQRVIQIASASSRTLALTETGEIYEWGFTRMGDMVLSRHSSQRLLPSLVLLHDKVTAIFTASESIYALSTKGELWAWGNNRYHQLGVELESAQKKYEADQKAGIKKKGRKKGVKHEELYTRPQICLGFNHVLDGEDVLKLVGGDNHIVILTKSGKLYGVGSNKDSQLGTGNNIEYRYLIPLENFNNLSGKIVDVVCGTRHTIVLMKDGTMYGSGYNSSYQMGRTEDEIVETPVKLRYGKKMNDLVVRKIASGADFTLMGVEPK